ncbi:hypothetical protein B0H19DRAFT_1229937 [Mycena capillaripes]|nr:hypothetical protein B0H19DRAFT_1229937 [Mycena capillaripes]
MAPERSRRKTKGTEAMTCRRQPRDGRLDVLKSCSMKQFLHLEASWFLRLEQYGLEERAEGMENPEQARADLDIEQEFGRGRDKAGGREEVGSGRLVDVVVVGGKKDQHGRPSLDADSLIKQCTCQFAFWGSIGRKVRATEFPITLGPVMVVGFLFVAKQELYVG